MSKVATLEQDVRSLTRDELSEFREWFVEFDAEQWDQQIEKDAKAGKLDRLAARALESHRRGESREM